METVFQKYPQEKRAFINPEDLTKQNPDFPALCVSTFSYGIIDKLASLESVDIIDHYPRYSTIRGNFQIVAIYKDFKEISSDNLSLHDTVKVTKENRRL